MLEAAKRAGITSIVCTPHCRDPWFDYDAMWDAFDLLNAHAGGFPLSMGFEVNHVKLMQLGMAWVEYVKFDQTNEFLLELSDGCTAYDFREYERTIFELQGMGLEVIIAHPERYAAIQKDIGIAENLVKMGCRLQASSNCENKGPFNVRTQTAKKLFARGLYDYVCSDAHRVPAYKDYERVCRKYNFMNESGFTGKAKF